MPVPFKAYADFESYEASYSKKYQYHIPCTFDYEPVSVDDKLSKPIVVYRGKNATEAIESILEEHEYCKKVMKKYCKNLIITEKEEEEFQ